MVKATIAFGIVMVPTALLGMSLNRYLGGSNSVTVTHGAIFAKHASSNRSANREQHSKQDDEPDARGFHCLKCYHGAGGWPTVATTRRINNCLTLTSWERSKYFHDHALTLVNVVIDVALIVEREPGNYLLSKV